MALRCQAEAMRRDGIAPEAIARALHAERRRLSLAFKERTPEPLRTRLSDRTLSVYGDPLGPSVEDLRAKGKSWDEIIESAACPGRMPVNGSFPGDSAEVCYGDATSHTAYGPRHGGRGPNGSAIGDQRSDHANRAAPAD